MKPALFALTGFASLALLGAPLHAADNKDNDPPGFNELDRDNDGGITRSEAARNPTLAKRFSEADGDRDGKVTRAEYLKIMAAKDFNTLREKTASAVDPDSKEKPEERGFNELDKNGDGKVSRAEAARNPKVAQKFAQTDSDKDGYLTRTEYLKTAAAEDWRDFRDWAADVIRPDDKASAGGSSK
jgi:Ca2+-binding EF-hand superfamily protein